MEEEKVLTLKSLEKEVKLQLQLINRRLEIIEDSLRR